MCASLRLRLLMGRLKSTQHRPLLRLGLEYDRRYCWVPKFILRNALFSSKTSEKFLLRQIFVCDIRNYPNPNQAERKIDPGAISTLPETIETNIAPQKC